MFISLFYKMLRRLLLFVIIATLRETVAAIVMKLSAWLKDTRTRLRDNRIRV